MMPIGERHHQRKGRNFAIAGILFAMAVIFFVATIVKLQGGAP